MMFNNKLVCCLKANGKILREFKDTVYVPFGSEYSILVKNLNPLRAVATITIDGVDVVPGGLVVNANQEIELERFVKDMSVGNKFKFIERTTSIEDYRGIKTDDGIIRISFKYEQLPVGQFTNTLNVGMYPRGNTVFGDTYIAKSAMYSSSQTINCSVAASQLNNCTLSAQSDVGITVPGSISTQKFNNVSSFLTESEEHVMVFRILGDTSAGTPVAVPVTVNYKPKCQTCGHVNAPTSKFCAECGTSLTVV